MKESYHYRLLYLTIVFRHLSLLIFNYSLVFLYIFPSKKQSLYIYCYTCKRRSNLVLILFDIGLLRFAPNDHDIFYKKNVRNSTRRLYIFNGDYFFLVTTFFLGAGVVVFLAGDFLIIFLATAFFIGAFVIVCVVVMIVGLAIFFVSIFLPRYVESSNARIGMKMIFNNVIPIP